jgi:hypothetical protein
VIEIIGAILGSLGLVSLVAALVILAQFSKKLGAVTKMRAFYSGYYVAASMVSVAVVVRFIRVSVFWAPPGSVPSLLTSSTFYLFLYHLPLTLGLGLGLLITWHYWSWLLKER